MKRFLSILLALLMIMCFVGCKDPETDFNDVTKPATKPETKPSVPDSVDDDRIIINTPELPKSEGSDPFINLTELKIDELNRIKINSENKTMTAIQYFDDDDPYFIEYNYSYKEVDEKINVYLVIAKILDRESRELLSVQDYYYRIKTNTENSCRLDLLDSFSYYEECFGSEEWNNKISYWNKKYETNFSEEEFIPENFDEILRKTLNADVLKSDILEEQLRVISNAEVVRHFIFELSDIGFEESKAKVSLEGVFDVSKKWYEQPNGFFTDGDSNFSLNQRYLDLDFYYWVSSIGDSKFETTYSKNGESYTKSFNYTISGTGKDAVVSVKITDDDTLVLTWEPMSNLIIYL